MPGLVRDMGIADCPQIHPVAAVIRYLHIGIIIRRFDPEPPPKTQPDVLMFFTINGAGSSIPCIRQIIVIVAVELISDDVLARIAVIRVTVL